MHKNCLSNHPTVSTYYSVWKEKYVREWGLIPNKEGMLDRVHIGNGQGYIMSGISYWTTIDAVKIIDRIDQLIAAGDYENLFWDNAVIDSIPLLNPIRIERVDGIYEIDTVEELEPGVRTGEVYLIYYVIIEHIL